MNSKILIGSTVYGSAGIGCKVLSIDGDTLTIETSKGEGKISMSRVVKVEPLSLLDRLLSIASVGKQEAIEQLIIITAESTTNDIYEASLDLETFAGIFIRRILADIKPLEFAEIGTDGSEGKYGLWIPTDSPPPDDTDSPDIGRKVTHIDLYHCRGADVGTIELVDSFGDYHVRWKSDGQVRRYSVDNLKLVDGV